jgi:hypothetical protein
LCRAASTDVSRYPAFRPFTRHMSDDRPKTLLCVNSRWSFCLLFWGEAKLFAADKMFLHNGAKQPKKTFLVHSYAFRGLRSKKHNEVTSAKK